MEEIWKEMAVLKNKNGVEFTPDKYEVSTLGRIRTKKQRYGRPRKATGKRVDLAEYRYLNGRPDRVGYIQVDLFDKDSNRYKARIHNIVMQTFVGYPEDGQVVCHYDDVKNNNKLSNLRYDTQKANSSDKRRNQKIKLY